MQTCKYPQHRIIDFFNGHLTDFINKALFHIYTFRMFAATYTGVYIRTTVL